jgi:hypothetical protein
MKDFDISAERVLMGSTLMGNEAGTAFGIRRRQHWAGSPRHFRQEPHLGPTTIGPQSLSVFEQRL